MPTTSVGIAPGTGSTPPVGCLRLFPLRPSYDIIYKKNTAANAPGGPRLSSIRFYRSSLRDDAIKPYKLDSTGKTMLPDQNTVKVYHVYTYTFLDDLSCIQSPFEHFQYEERDRIEDAVQLVGDRFREFGWEGDGSIGIIWLPPFVDVGIEGTWGTYIWHVKQQNNGISFLASDVYLDFKRLADQNCAFTPAYTAREMIPITIIETCVNWFTKAVTKTKAEIVESASFIKVCPDQRLVPMASHLLFHYQNVLVRLLHEFMDDCYLQVLIEAIESGNLHKITLRKTRVDVDPTSYVPTPDDSEIEDTISDANSWFTIRGLISDMWKAYKWEPFKKKAELLFHSLDYTPDDHDFFEIKKHIVIRNCMQHHEARLDRDSLKILGRGKISILAGNGMQTIDVWKPISMTEEELVAFSDLLLKFANDFHKHVAKRIPTRHFLTKNLTTPPTGQ
jgi:hypothetical protein